MRLHPIALALVALPLYACAASSDSETAQAPQPVTPATQPPATQPPGSTPVVTPSMPSDEKLSPTGPVATNDFADVSATAICAARESAKPLGTYQADTGWEIDNAIDASAIVTAVKTAAGDYFNDLSLTFVYPKVMEERPSGAVPRVTVGHWTVAVKAPKEGVDAIVPGASVDVGIMKMGKLTTTCTNEPGGGALSFEGEGDPGKLVITARTEKLIEGTIERTLPNGTTAKLSFRAPLTVPAATGDTVCCMPR